MKTLQFTLLIVIFYLFQLNNVQASHPQLGCETTYKIGNASNKTNVIKKYKNRTGKAPYLCFRVKLFKNVEYVADAMGKYTGSGSTNSLLSMTVHYNNDKDTILRKNIGTYSGFRGNGRNSRNYIKPYKTGYYTIRVRSVKKKNETVSFSIYRDKIGKDKEPNTTNKAIKAKYRTWNSGVSNSLRDIDIFKITLKKGRYTLKALAPSPNMSIRAEILYRPKNSSKIYRFFKTAKHLSKDKYKHYEGHLTLPTNSDVFIVITGGWNYTSPFPRGTYGRSLGNYSFRMDPRK